jgi:hypothetical protein
VSAAAPGPVEVVASPSAPAGSADATRRWALAMPDGATRFPGVTRTEGAAAAEALAAMDAAAWETALVEITLPVVLSDGAGPYLLDRDGRITLVVAAHPGIRDVHVAIGAPSPGHRLGIVARRAPGVWGWLARVEASPGDRVAALDGLDACPDLPAAVRWAREWPG